jgi:hypothetical protein
MTGATRFLNWCNSDAVMRVKRPVLRGREKVNAQWHLYGMISGAKLGLICKLVRHHNALFLRPGTL